MVPDATASTASSSINRFPLSKTSREMVLLLRSSSSSLHCLRATPQKGSVIATWWVALSFTSCASALKADISRQARAAQKHLAFTVHAPYCDALARNFAPYSLRDNDNKTPDDSLADLCPFG